MHRVHVLTEGYDTLNSRAFVFPILRYRSALRDRGVSVKFFSKRTPEITDCDVLLFDSKHYIEWWSDENRDLYRELEFYADAVERLLWFDNSDSTGIFQAPVLEYVDLYCKSQLLTDRQQYTEPLYGCRLFTDYYHDEYGLVDSNEKYSDTIEERHLDKLRVSWNFGMADHSQYMQFLYHLMKRLPYSVVERYPWDRYFRIPGYWTEPENCRLNDVSGRFGTGYDRETVQFQRERAEELLNEVADTDLINRWRYWQELKSSKVVVSPFGWGEPCYRDFEAFLAGGVLVKPEMDHLETWPPVYEAGETMITVSWDLEDLIETIEEILADYEAHRRIAERGQERYRQYLVGKQAESRFVHRFLSLVT